MLEQNLFYQISLLSNSRLFFFGKPRVVNTLVLNQDQDGKIDGKIIYSVIRRNSVKQFMVESMTAAVAEVRALP